MTLRKATYLLFIVAFIIAGTTIFYKAEAHGSMQSPVSRVYACFLEGPEAPDSQACIDAVAAGGTQPLYDWSEVNIRDAGGRHRELIPDGHLCSANRDKYAAYDAPRADWPMTLVQPGPYTFKWAVWANHVVSQLEVYVTLPGYNPMLPLKWADLELAFIFGPPTLAADNTYTFTGNLPNRTGHHVIYTIWQRFDSAEAFYSCSDVYFGTALPTPTPAPPCTMPAWSATTVYQNAEIVSYNNAEWQNQWYVQGEPPARTKDGGSGAWKWLRNCTGSGGNTTPVPTTVPTRAPTVSIPTNTQVVPTRVSTTAVPTRVSTTAVPTRATTAVPTRVPTTAVPTRATTAAPTRVPTTAVPTRVTTAVPTRVNTTVPTVAPTVTGGTLKLQYKAADTLTGDNQLKPHFKVVNTGTTAVALSELRIRYYFTKDNTAALTFSCDWAQVGCTNITGSFATASPATTTADTYLELAFTATAGSVAAGGNSGEIQARVNHSDWTNFNESNDWSFDATKTAFADWNRVVLLRNGTVVWGTSQ